MELNKKIICFGLILILLSSCTFQKRLHRGGYYVHWKHKTEKTEKLSETNLKSEVNEEPAFALNNNDFFIPARVTLIDSVKIVSCGDSLWTKEGNVSRVKIIEVNDYEIKYKRCANLNAPPITVLKSSLSKIKYENGEVEIFQTSSQNSGGAHSKSKRPSNNLAKASLNFTFLYLLFTAFFIAFIFFLEFLAALFFLGSVVMYFTAFATIIRALYLTKKYPEEYLGTNRAKAALTLLIIFTVLVILVLLLLLLLAVAGSGG